jgi:hypothetical protein
MRSVTSVSPARLLWSAESTMKPSRALEFDTRYTKTAVRARPRLMSITGYVVARLAHQAPGACQKLFLEMSEPAAHHYP